MQVLLFSTRSVPALETLHQLVVAQDPVEQVAVARSVEGLRRRLRSPDSQPDLAVLAVNRDRELAELLRLGELLRSARIVLVLPTREPATVALAHNLRPRFVAYTDGDPNALMAVVMKMIAQSDQLN